ncbi:MAG TPA: hypothetical protein VHB51_00700 [Candidatus Saccharimonadales bacterium]|nr:hypothetical protein [Candidatus Saccharimonadales bacterium]
MKNDLKQQVLKMLNLGDLEPEKQDVIVAKIELLANERLATALPELLSDEQYAQADQMRQAGKSDEEVMDWIESQLPNYAEMMEALILDIAEELKPTADSVK